MSSGRFPSSSAGRSAGLLRALCYSYCGMLYRRFDAVFALEREWRRGQAARLGIDPVDVVPLGVEVGEFGRSRRDPRLRRKLGLTDGQPLLIYVGRLDGEKKPRRRGRRVPPAAAASSARGWR